MFIDPASLLGTLFIVAAVIGILLALAVVGLIRFIQYWTHEITNSIARRLK